MKVTGPIQDSSITPTKHSNSLIHNASKRSFDFTPLHRNSPTVDSNEPNSQTNHKSRESLDTISFRMKDESRDNTPRNQTQLDRIDVQKSIETVSLNVNSGERSVPLQRPFQTSKKSLESSLYQSSVAEDSDLQSLKTHKSKTERTDPSFYQTSIVSSADDHPEIVQKMRKKSIGPLAMNRMSYTENAGIDKSLEQFSSNQISILESTDSSLIQRMRRISINKIAKRMSISEDPNTQGDKSIEESPSNKSSIPEVVGDPIINQPVNKKKSLFSDRLSVSGDQQIPHLNIQHMKVKSLDQAPTSQFSILEETFPTELPDITQRPRKSSQTGNRSSFIENQIDTSSLPRKMSFEQKNPAIVSLRTKPRSDTNNSARDSVRERPLSMLSRPKHLSVIDQNPKPTTIMIYALGTAGDVMPLIHLARGFILEGYSVQMLTLRRWKTRCIEEGITYMDQSEAHPILQTDEGFKPGTQGEIIKLAGTPKGLGAICKAFGPIVDCILATVDMVCKDADFVLLCGISNLLCDNLEALGKRYGFLSLKPWIPTSEVSILSIILT